MNVLLLLLACGSARRGEPLVGPIELDAGETRGQRVFMQHCHRCHPAGEAGFGPTLNNRPVPGFVIRAQVRLGVGAMPAFGPDRIEPEELRDVVAYLKAMRRHGP